MTPTPPPRSGSAPRYLTPDEKDDLLAEFERYKAVPGIWRRDHPENYGGTGLIDHEVLPLVDDLNALEGVCTTQSCCGHRYPWRDRETGEESEVIHPGQLWIRLSEAVAGAVQERVGDLLRHEVIVHVQRLYSFRDGTEPHDVLDIQWQDGCMDEAREIIAAFFRAVADPQEGRCWCGAALQPGDGDHCMSCHGEFGDES